MSYLTDLPLAPPPVTIEFGGETWEVLGRANLEGDVRNGLRAQVFLSSEAALQRVGELMFKVVKGDRVSFALWAYMRNGNDGLRIVGRLGRLDLQYHDIDERRAVSLEIMFFALEAHEWLNRKAQP